MRLLRALGLALVAARLGRDVGVAVQLAGLLPGRVDRLLRQVRRVGTHVGDVAVLVQPLRHAHRLRRGPAELAAGVHLQRRRGERRVGTAPVGLLVDPADADLAALEPGGEPAGAGLVEVDDVAAHPAGGRVEVAAGGDPAVVDADQLGADRRRLALVGRGAGPGHGEGALERPVVGGVERHPLPLALHDDAGGHRLHAAGRQLRQHLLPEHRADLVAVEPVEDAAGLLGVDQGGVELARVGDGAGDRLGGDLVEDHPVHGHAGLERVDQVPGDGLALAVLVCREVDLAGVLHQLLEPADLLLAVGADHVERLEGVVDVDAEPRPGGALVLGRDVGGVARQVADVPDARLDDVAAAQVSGDLVRLRRRLHDDQRLAPGRGRPPPGRRLRAAGGRVGALASGLAGLRGHGAPVGGAAVVPSSVRVVGSDTSAARIALRRATVSHRPDKAPGATLRGRAVTRTNVRPTVRVPGARRASRSSSGARRPATTSPTAASVGKSRVEVVGVPHGRGRRAVRSSRTPVLGGRGRRTSRAAGPGRPATRRRRPPAPRGSRRRPPSRGCPAARRRRRRAARARRRPRRPRPCRSCGRRRWCAAGRSRSRSGRPPAPRGCSARAGPPRQAAVRVTTAPGRSPACGSPARPPSRPSSPGAAARAAAPTSPGVAGRGAPRSSSGGGPDAGDEHGDRRRRCPDPRAPAPPGRRPGRAAAAGPAARPPPRPRSARRPPRAVRAAAGGTSGGRARARSRSSAVGPVPRPGGHAVERTHDGRRRSAIRARCCARRTARPTRRRPRPGGRADGTRGCLDRAHDRHVGQQVLEVGGRERVPDAEAGQRRRRRPPRPRPRGAACRSAASAAAPVRRQRGRGASACSARSCARPGLGDQPLVGRQRLARRRRRRPTSTAETLGQRRRRRSGRRARTSSPPTPAARPTPSSRARQAAAGRRCRRAARPPGGAAGRPRRRRRAGGRGQRDRARSSRRPAVPAGERGVLGAVGGRRGARACRPARRVRAATHLLQAGPGGGGGAGGPALVPAEGRGEATPRRSGSGRRPRRARRPAPPSSAASASTASGTTVKDASGSGCDIAASVVVPAQGGPEATDARSCRRRPCGPSSTCGDRRPHTAPGSSGRRAAGRRIPGVRSSGSGGGERLGGVARARRRRRPTGAWR